MLKLDIEVYAHLDGPVGFYITMLDSPMPIDPGKQQGPFY